MPAAESILFNAEHRNRHLIALAVSLLLHILLFSLVVAQKRTHFLDRLVIVKVRPLARTRPQVPPAQPSVPEVPLVFVEVDIADPVPPPPQTPYYSDKSSRAANPQPDKDTAVPKVEGTQDKVVRTTDKTVPRKTPEPVPPPVQAKAETKPQIEPKTEPPAAATTGLAPGPLAMNKPQPEPNRTAPSEAAKPAVRVRPRTLKDALQQNPGLAGEKMKQAGGVKRSQLEASFDVRETSFGAYDRKFIEAVQQRWYDLLETGTFARNRTGKVSIAFRLNMDGRITNMQLLDEDVGPLLAIVCQRAVMDPQPYGPWPSEMKKAISKNYREVTFTFYYQ